MKLKNKLANLLYTKLHRYYIVTLHYLDFHQKIFQKPPLFYPIARHQFATPLSSGTPLFCGKPTFYFSANPQKFFRPERTLGPTPIMLVGNK